MSDIEIASTGFGPIDEEHRAICAALRDALAAMRAGDAPALAARLQRVHRELAAHFAHEELLMAEYGFPKRARHKDAHDTYLADTAGKIRVLQRDGLTADLRRWVTGRLFEWARFHISANDVELGRFLRDRVVGEAVPPAAALDAMLELIVIVEAP